MNCIKYLVALFAVSILMIPAFSMPDSGQWATGQDHQQKFDGQNSMMGNAGVNIVCLTVCKVIGPKEQQQIKSMMGNKCQYGKDKTVKSMMGDKCQCGKDKTVKSMMGDKCQCSKDKTSNSQKENGKDGHHHHSGSHHHSSDDSQ